MAALTWRNVDSPDFSPSLQGFQQFSQMLNGALGTAKAGLKEYDDITTDRMNKALAVELAGIHGDPEEYKTNLADILAKYDPDRLSFENITAANNKVGQLSNEALTGLNLKSTKYDFDNKIERDAALEALAPFANQISTLRGQNTAESNAKADAILASPEFAAAMQGKGLKPSDSFGFIRDAQGIESGALGIDSSRLGLDSARYSFDRRKITDGREDTAYNEGRAADDLVVEAYKATGGVGGLSAMFDYLQSSGANAHVVQAAIRQLPGYESFTIPDLPAGSYSGGSGAGDGYDTVLGNGAYGKPPKPITSMTIGEAVQFGRDVLIPNSKKAGVGKDARGVLGSSAMGAYQFTQETLAGKNGKPGLAERVLGKNWQNITFTPEVQDRLAEQLFNDSKKGNLKAIWEGLPDSRPGAYANKSWDEMRQIIARHEGAGDLPTPSQMRAAAGGAIAVAPLNNGAGDPVMTELASNIMKGWDDNTPAIDVANQLIKSGRFPGADVNVLSDAIKNLGQNAGVKPYVAGAMLSMSTRRKGFFEKLGDNVGSGFGYGNTGTTGVDDERLAQLVTTIKRNPQALTAAVSQNLSQKDAMAAAAAAPAQMEALSTRLATLQQRRSRASGQLARSLDNEIYLTQKAMEGVANAGNGATAQVLVNVGARPSAPAPAPARRNVMSQAEVNQLFRQFNPQPAQAPRRPAPTRKPDFNATVASIYGNNPLFRR